MCELPVLIIGSQECTYERNKNSVRVFLQNKDLNEDFIADVLENGLTDDIVRRLECCGLAYDDIASIGIALNPPSCPPSNPSCDCTFRSGSEVSDKKIPKGEYSDYLREHLGDILPGALREIAERKPIDPVEYLGHWLLHYRDCEEREKLRREFASELFEERLKWRKAVPSSSVMSVCEEEEGDEEE